ncbi:Cyclic pyranopterin monophosphate synthase [Pseudodesulfovibrio hydrargyri]|uniref:Cyclic pyranopterin monophosphate synthase n=1 Tax=Pseudodesulfovibrio hydrargyri TaxID=2125990 RepID=A0A1J5MTT9_9BACT|nr:radical SAM/SPASM domain-containing protein [Pseudodesulfovibrio hydrargyri]OIQ50046.1 Cyclic pyranopterin monophosphate synthase [Pseudodesulfovibrio hydrargyri]
MKLKEVEIETHTVCNARCRYCAYPGMAKRVGSKLMSIELFDRILKELDFARPDIERIHLHHVNEPLVRKDIADLVARARKAYPDKEVGFSTNAILMTPERAEAVLKAGLNLLYTTIPSSDPEAYSHIMGVKADVNRVIANIAAFIEMAGPDVRIVVRSPLSFDQGLIDALGHFDGITMEHVPLSSRLGAVEQDMLDASGGITCSGAPAPCSKTWMLHSLVILHEGDVPICCNDQEHTCIVGDIRGQSIEALWNSERFDEVRGWMMGKNRPDGIPCNICEYGCREGE